MSFGRQSSVGGGIAVVVLLSLVLGWNAWDRYQIQRRAKAAALSACSAGEASVAECKQRIEAKSADCFERTYTPSRGGGKYSKRTPAQFDAVGYQACVLGQAP
jgi:hypothetical protein